MTETLGGNPEHRFFQTSWTMVLRAQSDDESDAAAAMENLCRSYWYPLYAFARHGGNSREDAQDLVQAFFSKFIEDRLIHRADRDRGKLRTFLLTVFKRFMINEWRRASAKRRGGDVEVVPIDFDEGEVRYGREPSSKITPEHYYDQLWAKNLLDRAMERLRCDYDRRGSLQRFEALRETLWWNSNDLSYEELGSSLDLDPNSVKQAVHRLREQYRKALREEVAATIDDPDEAAVSAELAELVAVLRQASESEG